ncbi:MAG TPA: hypothetical protein VNL71_00040 [Chloroflexota bacterium]|nr:hypothetical protein [Chloroflexota bacterium]
MYRAVITNRGKAWLEEPTTTITRRALAIIAESCLEAETPRAMVGVFGARIRERLDISLDDAAVLALWQELGHEAVIKVRQPLPADTSAEFVLTDPPVEAFRDGRGWGGKREGSGQKPRDPAGRKRVQKSVMLAPDVYDKVALAQAPGETFSETLDRLVRAAPAVVG